jgi:hypothetical protein
VPTTIYDDPEEAARQLAVIDSIASETRHPVDEVRRVYEAHYARLKEGARITSFLSYFASRRAREALGADERLTR